jgi:hypothetical protein
MAVICGRVCRTPGEEKPYKVVLEHEDHHISEHPVATVREGEEMIRRSTPRPAMSMLNQLRDTPEVAQLRSPQPAG